MQQRVRDAGARGDRYMLMSFEEFPANVKVRVSLFWSKPEALPPEFWITTPWKLAANTRKAEVVWPSFGALDADSLGCRKTSTRTAYTLCIIENCEHKKMIKQLHCAISARNDECM